MTAPMLPPRMPPSLPPRAKALRLWERLTWPQVAALALTAAGLAGIAHALPASFWDSLDAATVLSAVLALLGIGGGAVAGPLFRRAD
jgi:hypothetical protein